MFAALFIGCGSAIDLRRLKQQGRKKEIGLYSLLTLSALTLLGLNEFWKNMPSLYELVHGMLNH